MHNQKFYPQSWSGDEDYKFLYLSQKVYNVNTEDSTANIFRYALSPGEWIQPSLCTKNPKNLSVKAIQTQKSSMDYACLVSHNFSMSKALYRKRG